MVLFSIVSGCLASRRVVCGKCLLPITNKAYRKCCVEHDKLRRTMDAVFRFLHRHKIEFWLGMGSLLGAHRNNGTIIAPGGGAPPPPPLVLIYPPVH